MGRSGAYRPGSGKVKGKDEEASVWRKIQGLPESRRDEVTRYVLDRRGRAAFESDKLSWRTIRHDVHGIAKWGEYLRWRPFNDATADDARGFLKALVAPKPAGYGLSESTAGMTFVRVDQFMKWVHSREEYLRGATARARMARHPATAWWTDDPAAVVVNTNRDYEPADMLAPGELAEMRRVAFGVLERGMLALLMGSGFRGGSELCQVNTRNVRIEQVNMRKRGEESAALVNRAELTLPTYESRGRRKKYKTTASQRTVEVLVGVEDIIELLEDHPLKVLFDYRQDLQMPLLWVAGKGFASELQKVAVKEAAAYAARKQPERIVSQVDCENLRMTLPTMNYKIRKIAERAGIKKRWGVTSHLFRHSLATFFVGMGVSDFLMRQRFGWSPTSEMVNRYAHLNKTQMNAAFARAMGYETEDSGTPFEALEGVRCRHCGVMNNPDRIYCGSCKVVLDAKRLRAAADTMDLMARTHGNPVALSDEATVLSALLWRQEGWLDSENRVTRAGAEHLREVDELARVAAGRARKKMAKKLEQPSVVELPAPVASPAKASGPVARAVEGAAGGSCAHVGYAGVARFCGDCGDKLCVHEGETGRFCSRCGLQIG